MNTNKKFDGSGKFGGVNPDRFSISPPYADVNAPKDSDSISSINIQAEATALGVQLQQSELQKKLQEEILGATADVNVMDILTGAINLTRFNETNPPPAGLPSGSSPTGITSSILATPSSMMVDEIKKLKEDIERLKLLINSLNNGVADSQEVINNILEQEKNRFDEDFVKTTNEQIFFFDKRKEEASLPPAWV